MEKQFVIVCLYGETYRFIMDRPYLPATITDQFLLAKRFPSADEAFAFINEELMRLNNFIGYESDVADFKLWKWKGGQLASIRPKELSLNCLTDLKIFEVTQDQSGTYHLIKPTDISKNEDVDYIAICTDHNLGIYRFLAEKNSKYYLTDKIHDANILHFTTDAEAKKFLRTNLDTPKGWTENFDHSPIPYVTWDMWKIYQVKKTDNGGIKATPIKEI